MITCEECGKFNQQEQKMGDHWICEDCKVNEDSKKE